MRISRASLAVALAVVAVVLFILFRPRTRVESSSPPRSRENPGEATEIRPRFRETEINSSRSPTTRPAGSVTARQDDPTSRPDIQQRTPVTGWVIDDYQQWLSIPSEYLADNIIVANGGLTVLADGAHQAGLMTGRLESPALPLRQPTVAVPSEQRKILPQGTSVRVEVSFSRDGGEWTAFNILERYEDSNRSTGKGLSPGGDSVLQGEPATANAMGLSGQGPFIKYRITISTQAAESGKPFVLKDLRVWNAEALAPGKSDSDAPVPLIAIPADPEDGDEGDAVENDWIE